jgi:hypothetical protein
MNGRRVIKTLLLACAAVAALSATGRADDQNWGSFPGYTLKV